MLNRRLLVFLFISLLSVNAFSQNNTKGKTLSDISDDTESVRIVDPKKDIQLAESATIDTEKFELGLYAGFLAVEDFNTNPILGLSFSYHLTPKVLLQLNYAESEVDKASFENLRDGDSFLSDADRNFEFYNLLVGYKVLRGRSFFGADRKYNSDIYLTAGLGSVDFAGSSNTSFILGASYRVVLTDYLVANLDIRGHSVDRDFLGENKRTFNTEYVLGFNFLF